MMDVELMQAESIIGQFVDFYERAMSQMASESVDDGLPPIDAELQEQLITSLRVMKTIFIANLTIRSSLKEAGFDPDEFDKRND